MPVFLVLDERDSFAFVCLRNESPRLISGLCSEFIECRGDRGIIMAIDRNGVPARSLELVDETLDVKLIHGALALAQAINVDGSKKIRSLVMTGKCRRFPDRTFGALPISHKDVRVERNLIQARGNGISQRR